MRKNRYMLTVQDGFTRFASAYPICNQTRLGQMDCKFEACSANFQPPNKYHRQPTRPNKVAIFLMT